MKNKFYDYLKYRSKPLSSRLTEQYVNCYKELKALTPFTENYLAIIENKTKELKELECKIEELGGIAIAGVVSFRQKAVKKYIQNK